MQIFKKYPDVTIRVPNVTVIATDEFDLFMNKNNLCHLCVIERHGKMVNMHMVL